MSQGTGAPLRHPGAGEDGRMEGTIGTPPLQEDPLQGFCSDLWKFLSCGPETGPVTAQDRALHGDMDPWLPRVIGAVTTQDRALHGGMDPWLTHDTGAVTAQHRALHGGMDPWLPRVTGAVTAPDRALHGGKDPWLTSVMGAAHSQPGSCSARNQSWADGSGGQEQ